MDYEKLGLFYLGTELDPSSKEPREPLLVESNDLTTHAVCLGMTGSGKTGLCLALVEEALLDGVPVLAIDPKGDLGNLLLTFPDLAPADFAPWVDAAEARRQGITPDELAVQTAARWRQGLAESGQDPQRIARLRAAGGIDLYTPGSDAGLGLSVLGALRAPRGDGPVDEEAMAERQESAAGSLLALLSIPADPLASREHLLLSQIAGTAFRAGRDLTLEEVVHAVMRPPFERVGAFDLETFFPSADRTALALRLNALLASPAMAAWTRGKPLDVPSLLWGTDGKPRVAILSIAHLDDAARMFVVTLVLQELVSFMRRQPGTSSLRALLFMDEVAGTLPPTAAPPSKKPMLTLLKQARAYGLGVVLASQNPVDLDYKALANAGTWFLGRMQTERDKARVLDGLEGARTSGQPFDRAAMEATLAGLRSREFVLHDVRAERPSLFRSRFTMSYLAGPLTRPQIQGLVARAPAAEIAAAPTPAAATPTRPVVPAALKERFSGSGPLSPALVGRVKVHYADKKRALDVWRELAVVAPLEPGAAGDLWEHATVVEPAALAAGTDAPPADATFGSLPLALNDKAAARLSEDLSRWAFRAAPLAIWEVPALKLASRPDESEAELRARVALAARESRDAAVQKLRDKAQARLDALDAKKRTVERKVEAQRTQARRADADTAISLGASVLGSLFGGRRGVRGITSVARSVSRAAEQRSDVTRATEEVAELSAARAAEEAELAQEIAAVQARPDPEVVRTELPARKADSVVTSVVLLWRGRA